jgi:hypothetical protein
MKSPKFRPLDLSGTSAPDPAADDLPEAPEDLHYARADLRGAESLGAVTRGQDRDIEDRRETIDLPPLNLNPRPGAVRFDEPPAAPIYIAAAVVSCLWALAPIMFALGYRRGVAPFESDAFALTVFALMALGPVALVWISAFLLHQGARLAAQARRTQALADAMVEPAALAARGVGTAVETVRLEIDHASAAAATARGELLNLRDLLAEESERLVAAAAGSSRNATELTAELGAEREKMNELAGLLGDQATSVVNAISQHARMVAEASDLAETQIREAEAALAVRAADLGAAAGEASDTARIAGEDLSRQVARLETASLGVGDQVRVLEEALTEQRAALVATAHGMRADHEAFSTEAETQKAQLAEILAEARGGAGEMNQTAAMTAEALRQLVGQASDQLKLMAETAAEERDLFGAAATQSMSAVSEIGLRQREALESQAKETIDALSEAAAHSLGAVSEIGLRQREDLESQAKGTIDALAEAAAHSLGAVAEIGLRQREALESQTLEAIGALSAAASEARRAAEEHGLAVRDTVDQLSEAAFSAGQQADVAFEARLSQARAMIEQSAAMVEEASLRSTTRLAEGVEAAQKASAALESLLSDIDSKAQSLPAAAQAQAQAVRESVDRSIGDLLESARRTAEETQAIDAVFQDRVRRNYDMLSEAVRLMGVVAGAAGGPLRAPAPRAAAQATMPAQPAATVIPVAAPPAPAVAESHPSAPAREDDGPAGLRPRLKLTPTATDEEFKTVFDAAGGRDAPTPAGSVAPPAPPPAGGDSWTWKELLSSMDEGMGEGLGDDKALADRLINEVAAMGVDAGALLPRMRIDQIAAAIQAGEVAAGREIVRRLAPAAVRRLGRRMIADRGFRGQVDRYVQRYAAMIAETRGDGQNFVISALLGSDQGRAFLLFDAAIHETA